MSGLVLAIHPVDLDALARVLLYGLVAFLAVKGRSIVPGRVDRALLRLLPGSRAHHPPEWALEAAGTALGSSFRVVERAGAPRLQTAVDGWREASIELDSREARDRYTATLSLQLRGPSTVTGEGHFRLDGTGTHGVWPSGVSPDPRFEQEGRLAVEWLVRVAHAKDIRVAHDRVLVRLETRPELWSDWAKALRELESVAKALDPAAPPVAIHLDARETGELGSLRCAYCHADLAPHEPEVSRCERCGTVLHVACRAELGRCPALGCGASERPRESAGTG